MRSQPSVLTANSPLSFVWFTTGKSVQFVIHVYSLCIQGMSEPDNKVIATSRGPY